MGKIKARKFFRDSLREKYEQGRAVSKNEKKNAHNSTPYIHSNATYKTYVKACDRFAEWLKGEGITDKDIAFAYVPSYLQSLEDEGKSAWTILGALNAISKAYGVPTTSFRYNAPKRERASIKRSRYTAKRDEHFSEAANKELIDFVSATGLRRHELEALRGTDLVFVDGTYKICVRSGKGGKRRMVDIVGTKKEVKHVIDACQRAKEGKVFSHIHSAMDVHYYRGLYACRCYRSKARPLETLRREEKYYCRKDKKGCVYDRQAMLYASRQLGHNRIDVIANNYLYNL